MTESVLPASALNPSLRGDWRLNELLSKYTTWRVGGPARRLYCPADIDDLALFLNTLSTDESLFWLGLGSNVLVRDGGLPATVICTLNRLKQLYREQAMCIYAEAGVPCSHVAKYSAHLGWGGAEFLAGIPGTVGGALAMNAGAFGSEMWDIVETVTTINRQGTLLQRKPIEYQIGYRYVKAPEQEWFVAARLRLKPSSSLCSREKIKTFLARRQATQPTHWPSCGSVFRNPEGEYAARLIEACGLKGYTIGNAQVSEKHANFIVNLGSASAREIETLILYIQSVVYQERGYYLVPEVKIVGIT